MTNSTVSGMNRRNFLKASAVTAMASALAATRASSALAYNGARPSRQDATLDILNYALTLEHLEATAYRQALATGLLSGVTREYFVDFGAHEASHVDTLTSVIRDLGGTPVQAQASYNFPTFQSANDILTFFHDVEELGAAAYLAQAPFIADPDLLTAAVAIHNVEGQHAAVLGDLLGLDPSPAFAEGKSMEQVLQVVRPLLQADMMPSEMPSTGFGGMMTSFGPQRSR